MSKVKPCEGDGKGRQRVVETCAKSKTSEGGTGGESNWLIEVVSKGKLGEGGRKVGDGEVKVIPKRQATESGGVIDWLIKAVSEG